MKYRIILGLSAILFFTGCYNREYISRLDEVEALLQNKPDSALTILKQFKREGSQAEQAKYALLYSAALDKNHLVKKHGAIMHTARRIYAINAELSTTGDVSSYVQETNREHCAFFSKLKKS